MPPLIIAAILAVPAAGLLASIGVTIARNGDHPADPDHPGFGDIPPDDPDRPLHVDEREPDCSELDDPDLTAPVARAVRATADQCLSRPALGEQLPPTTVAIYQAGQPGRHRAPEPGHVPADLATYPAWVAAGCPAPGPADAPVPHSAGWWTTPEQLGAVT